VARKGNILQDIISESGPMGECWTPVCTIRASGYGLGPPRKQTGPLCGVRAAHNTVSGFWDREYLGLNQGQAGSGANMCPNLIVYASAPRPGGDPMLPRGLLHVT
jgi:hypothetical protein